jgi:predicted transcriptional regulator YdeE
MEKVNIDKDIKVFYITATSFPEGVMDAYEKLHSIVKDADNRKYFGISQPNPQGTIVYKAATEELENGEAEKLGCETFVIQKGEYISITIKDHFNHPTSIGDAFRELIARPDIDPQGYCLEYYTNYKDKDVKCMVGLAK